MNATITIPDDSGFLGLLDPARYRQFIGDDFDFGDFHCHVIDQMGSGALLFWATGIERDWRVQVTARNDESVAPGVYRSIVGFIIVTDDRLLIVNYETVSMAAQFDDIRLPEPYLAYCQFTIPCGAYHCRVSQKADPDAPIPENPDGDGWDFHLQLRPAAGPSTIWSRIQWLDS